MALLSPSLSLLPSHGEQIEKERRGEGKLNFCLLLLLRSFAAAAENFYELSSLSPSSTLVNKKFLPPPFFQTGDGDPPFPRKVITALCRVATPQKKERRRGGGGGYSPLLCPSGPIFPSPSRRRRISFHFPPNCEAKKYIPSVDGEKRRGEGANWPEKSQRRNSCSSSDRPPRKKIERVCWGERGRQKRGKEINLR